MRSRLLDWFRRRRLRAKIAAGVSFALGIVGVVLINGCVNMPGKSHRGPLSQATPEQVSLAEELRRDVDMLALSIGERNTANPRKLALAADFVERAFQEAGWEPVRQNYELRGVTCTNLIAEKRGAGKPNEIVIIGGHYDSAPDCPGANDNATAVAALLAIARRLRDSQPECTLRLVAFTNEEPPHFQRDTMGSLVYARSCRKAGDNVVAMLALDGLGFYSDASNSQNYPVPVFGLYPSEANFIAFIGNFSSRDLLRRSVKSFRASAAFPSRGAALPGNISGVGWSDHWSFWQEGYPGIMVTDTLPFRYKHYHTPQDTPDKIDFDKMSRVVEGLVDVTAELAGAKPNSR